MGNRGVQQVPGSRHLGTKMASDKLLTYEKEQTSQKEAWLFRRQKDSFNLQSGGKRKGAPKPSKPKTPKLRDSFMARVNSLITNSPYKYSG